MKIRKVLFSLFSTITCVSTAYAFVPQLYVGAQGGFADTNYSISNVKLNSSLGGGPVTSASIHNHVTVGRGYGGYMWNEYIGTEFGYTRWRETRFTQVNNGTEPNGDISMYAIDFTGKLFLPMAAYIHLSPYLKLGANYLDARSSGSITRNGASDFGYSWHPLFGAGIGYDFTPNLMGDIAWTRITKRNSSVPQNDMYTLGLTYHFSYQEAVAGPNAGNYGALNGTDP